MKWLVFLSLLSSGTASAAPNVFFHGEGDLDGDGRPDSVTTLDSGDSDFVRLEVRLSASAKTLHFDRLVKRTWDQKPGRYENDGSICHSVTETSFKLNPGSLSWTEKEADMDACNHFNEQTLLLRVRNGILFAEKIRYAGGSRSSGDPSPYSASEIDFGRRKASAMAGESHTGKEGRGKAAFSGNCPAPTLAQVEADTLPQCATRALSAAQSQARKNFCAQWHNEDCPL